MFRRKKDAEELSCGFEVDKNNITDADSVVTRSIPGYYVAVILA